ncbi:MAG: cupin domain-containing protein [Tissierellaceae bacterium]|nr:cupin domain-containing protein [Tissierellaceae bacterium]
MLIKKDDLQVSTTNNLKDGIGAVKLTHITDAQGLCEKGRLFSVMELEPGCSIGSHIHENDFEIYYILEGEGEVTDDGVVKKVSAGDSMITHEGHEHSLKNIGDSTLKFIALILYA